MKYIIPFFLLALCLLMLSLYFIPNVSAVGGPGVYYVPPAPNPIFGLQVSKI